MRRQVDVSNIGRARKTKTPAGLRPAGVEGEGIMD
jgi:hypothetical protein